VFTVRAVRPSATIAAFHVPIVLGSSWPRGMSPKVGRMRFSTFLRVPYSEAGCWSFQAGHHLVVTYSPTRVRGLAGSGSVGWGSGSRPARSNARRSASASRMVKKMPAERWWGPSW
jgi:hypothetical protein